MSQQSGVRPPGLHRRFATASAIAVLTGAVAVGSTTPALASSPASGIGQTYFVDCSASSPGDGSAAHPFTTLGDVNALTLGPGDSVLFQRGTACTGMLAPHGGGASGEPIVIGAYGKALAPLPRLDGAGAVTAAVWLNDMSHVVVQNLELTNAGDVTTQHRGLYLTADAQPVEDVMITHLLVDKVDGSSGFNGPDKSGGGIIGQALSDTGHFSQILIADNWVHDVSRQGIYFIGTSQSGSRPAATSPWPQGASQLVIRDNLVNHLAGDGIVALGSDGAVIEHNRVLDGNLSGYSFFDNSKRDCSAGIWTFDANRTLIQYNEVSNMHYGPSTTPGALNGCDGDGFDVDDNQDGTVVQYNYSHNNDGGFILLCTGAAPHHADVRYNLSIDDNATFSTAPCPGLTSPQDANLSGIRLYNNTFVARTPRVTMELSEPLALLMTLYYGDFSFTNNIVYATSPSAAGHIFACGNSCSNNVFFHLPVPPRATNSVTADPRFVNASRRGSGFAVAQAFKLRLGSPAAHAGIAVPAGVPAPATTDFFGTLIANPPSIGFAQR